MMPRTDREDLISLLQDWSYAASRMVQGLEVSATGAVGGPAEAPPDDTGEALGLPAAGLTLTFGFGPGLFENEDGDRYGIAAQRPAGLERLPAFLGDDLDPQTSHGDLCIQACADDPQVAVHAIRNLSRIAFGRARLRWSQLGFGKTSRTTAGAGDAAQPLRVQGRHGEHPGRRHRSARRPRLGVLERRAGVAGRRLVSRGEEDRHAHRDWDRVRLSEQDNIIGRDKGEGAPLSGRGRVHRPRSSTPPRSMRTAT